MHRAAVLLACVCLVYANSSPDSFGPNARSAPQHSLISSPSSDPEDLNYSVFREQNLPSYDPNDPYAWYGHPIHQCLRKVHIDSVQKDVSSLVEPSVPLSLNSTHIRKPQIPWSAPPLDKALKDFDKGYTTVTAHFTESAFENKDDQKFRYIVLVHVVDQLSKEVNKNGWANYDRNYEGLVRKYIDEAIVDPRAAANAFYCAFHPVELAILPVRRVMEHPEVRFVCKAQPTSCDATILAILQYSSISRHTTDVLLSAGSVATTFLNNYSAVFEVISGQNIYKYLLESNEDLRLLVALYAQVFRVINKHEPNCKGPYPPTSSNR